MRLLTFGAMLVLVGCAQQRIQQADVALEAKVAECENKYPAGGHNNVARASCDENARRAVFAAHGAPSDLVEIWIATRADLSAKIDRQEVTAEQARLQMAILTSQLSERAQKRRAVAAEYFARTMPSPTPLAPLPMPRSVQTSCTRYGNQVDCTSY